MKTLERIFQIIFGVLVVTLLCSGTAVLGLVGYEYYEQSFDLAGGAPPPSYLLINGERWYIESLENLDKETGEYARTICDYKLIQYDKDLSVNMLRESVWHEVFHAELCHKNLPKYGVIYFLDKDSKQKFPNWQRAVDGEEHDVIYPLAMSQATFMHDNPEFVKWALNWK